MVRTAHPLWLFLGVLFLAGCATKIPHVIVPDYDKQGTRLIAVMPVGSSLMDQKSAEMLRTKLVEELYFKGYPKIPLNVIDEKLATMSPGSGEKLDPKGVGEMLKVDALLYSRLKESGMGSGIIYAATTVDAEFELLSVKTGKRLWRVQHRVIYRNYGFSRRQVELKSSQVYERALQEVVNRALETLPDGPDAIGS
ncbi:MAG: DUF799 family lipoprotein [Proteobacteria bacterium]|nr:DUF799 family lipoprotein [Pseudomonadota bacterium]